MSSKPKLLWSFEIDNVGLSPVIGTDLAVYFAADDSPWVYALGKDGKQLWRCSYDPNPYQRDDAYYGARMSCSPAENLFLACRVTSKQNADWLGHATRVPGINAQSFTYDDNDRLDTDTYDPNGNTTNSASVGYSYDFANHLTARGGGSPVQLVYDGDGNVVRKTVGTVTTYYLIDDLNPTGLPQVLEESESVGGGARTLKKAFVYGHDLISQKQVVSGATHFYGYDGHGNVRFLTDINGSVTDTYTFDAFGNLLASTGSTPNEYLHSGERWDPNLQFYYLRARFMNPQTGRFWTMDSFEGVLSEPGTLHKYLYTENNPVNLIDPTGNFNMPELLSVQAIDKIVKGIGSTGASFGLRRASITLLRSQFLKRLSAQALSKAGNALAKKIAQGWFKKYVKQFTKNMSHVAVLKVTGTTPGPAIRDHIFENIAQKKYTVLSSYLGREGALLRIVNRRVALSDDNRREPNGKAAVKLPGSPNNSFDEYPFASSLQGAALFPHWSSVKAVPASQNNSQGAQLKNHYQANGYKPGFTTIVLPMGHGINSTDMENKARELLTTFVKDLLGN